MAGRLEGRRIVITGAAAGIGAATARLFHQEGARLALIDVEPNGLKVIAEELGAVALPLDLADLDAIPPAIDQAARELDGLDGVVNCAGIGSGGPLGEITNQKLMLALAINLAAPFVLCRSALPYLEKQDGSTIVNIASGEGILPNSANVTAYAASKGGLINFTRALAAEVAPKVRANALCPGGTRTAMTAPLVAAYGDPNKSPFVQTRYALKRLAEPNEIANGILFLTSAESSYVTGIAMAVDGGRTFH